MILGYAVEVIEVHIPARKAQTKEVMTAKVGAYRARYMRGTKKDKVQVYGNGMNMISIKMKHVDGIIEALNRLKIEV